ncbi:MAG: 3'-5' exonuclease [Bacteroidetes bacterium]|nr:3'-5' exonuclease [Bacteroidota bacterium]
MLNFINIDKVLFIDIETVPQVAKFDELDDKWKELWTKKSSSISKNNETPDELYNKAGIYAEFGKIICISTGFLNKTGNQWSFRVKSYFGENEKKLLTEFSSLLNKYFSDTGKLLCAHNGKEFDFPFIARRILINELPLPSVLDLAGKKPWEVAHIDTMELWKFGDFKSFTSLDLLSTVFGISSSKDDIDGSMVYDVYYNEPEGLERIKRYCEKDVITLSRILLKMGGFDIFKDEDIVLLN